MKRLRHDVQDFIYHMGWLEITVIVAIVWALAYAAIV